MPSRDYKDFVIDIFHLKSHIIQDKLVSGKIMIKPAWSSFYELKKILEHQILKLTFWKTCFSTSSCFPEENASKFINCQSGVNVATKKNKSFRDEKNGNKSKLLFLVLTLKFS